MVRPKKNSLCAVHSWYLCTLFCCRFVGAHTFG